MVEHLVGIFVFHFLCAYVFLCVLFGFILFDFDDAVEFAVGIGFGVWVIGIALPFAIEDESVAISAWVYFHCTLPDA